MADVQILRAESGAVPINYTLPDAAELRLKAVYAEFTDGGAAADWLPCVTILSDSGDVIARAIDQAVKVTAGGGADVSWFPGVKNAGGGPLDTCKLTQSPTTQAIVSGAGLVPIDFTFLANNGTASFAWDAAVPSRLKIIRQGVYLLRAGGRWATGNYPKEMLLDGQSAVLLDMGVAVSLADERAESVMAVNPFVAGNPTAHISTGLLRITSGLVNGPQLYAAQTSGINRVVSNAFIAAVRLGDAV